MENNDIKLPDLSDVSSVSIANLNYDKNAEKKKLISTHKLITFTSLFAIVVIILLVNMNYLLSIFAGSHDTYDITVLELVGDYSQAVFGYSISGFEPIDISTIDNTKEIGELTANPYLAMSGQTIKKLVTVNELTNEEKTTYDLTNVRKQVGYFKRGANGKTKYAPVYFNMPATSEVKFYESDNLYKKYTYTYSDDELEDLENVYYVVKKNGDSYAAYPSSQLDALISLNGGEGLTSQLLSANNLILCPKEDVNTSKNKIAGTEYSYILGFKVSTSGEFAFYPAIDGIRYVYVEEITNVKTQMQHSSFYNDYYFASDSHIDTGTNSYMYKGELDAIETIMLSETTNVTNKDLFKDYISNGKSVNVVTKLYSEVTSDDVKEADLIYVNTKKEYDIYTDYYAYQKGYTPKLSEALKEKVGTVSHPNYYDLDSKTYNTNISEDVINEVLNKLSNQKIVIMFDKKITNSDITKDELEGLTKLYNLCTIAYPKVTIKCNLKNANSFSELNNEIVKLAEGYKVDYELLGVDNERLDKTIAEHNVLSLNDLNFKFMSRDITELKIINEETTKEVYEYTSDQSRIFGSLFMIQEQVDDGEGNITLKSYASPAIALQYLMNAQKKSLLSGISKMRFLEIEPCCDFYSKDYWSYRMLGIDPYFEGNVEVTQLQSKTYNGIMDNLYDKYDIVFFGGRYGLLNYENKKSHESEYIEVNNSLRTVTFADLGYSIDTPSEVLLPAEKIYAYPDGTWSVSELPNSTSSITLKKKIDSGTGECIGIYVQGLGYYGTYSKVPITLDGTVYYLNVYYTSSENIPGHIGINDSLFGKTNDSKTYSLSKLFGTSTGGKASYTITNGKGTDITATASGDTLTVKFPGRLTEDNYRLEELLIKQTYNVNPYQTQTFSSDFVNYDGTEGTVNYTYYLLSKTTNTIELLEGDPSTEPKLSEVDFNNKSNYETGQYSQTTGAKESNSNRLRIKNLIKVNPGTITAKLNYKDDVTDRSAYSQTNLAKYVFIIRELDEAQNLTASYTLKDGESKELNAQTKYLALGIYNTSTKFTTANLETMVNAGIEFSITTDALDDDTLTYYYDTSLCKLNSIKAIDTTKYKLVPDSKAINSDLIIVDIKTDKMVGFVTKKHYIRTRLLRVMALPYYFSESTVGVNTVYNDTTMNGKLYTHVGDKITLTTDNKTSSLKFNLGGNTFTNNDVDARLSGNDITRNGYESLVSFAKNGKIVMFSEVFYNSDDTINNSVLDDYSYVAKLIRNTDIKVYNESKFKNYDYSLFREKEYDINVISQPLVYRDYLKGTWKTSSVDFGTNYDTSDGGKSVYTYDELGITSASDAQNAFYITNRDINIKFEITQLSETNSNYQVELYSDSISDGFFSEDEKITSIRIFEGDKQVNANSLVAGKEYRLNFQCAETLSGLIHWQLRLYKNNEKDCFKEYQSYFALKPKTEAITLNILQIVPMDVSNTFAMEDNATFTNTISKVQEYNVVVFTAKENELLDSTGEALKTEIFTQSQVQARYDKFNSKTGRNITYKKTKGLGFYDFDMLVIGYGNYPEYATKKATVSAINNFIDKGKSVLMTHDTIDFNASKTNTHTALNKYLRTKVGQDRFGINYREEAPIFDYIGTVNDTTEYLKMGLNSSATNLNAFEEKMMGLGFDYSSNQTGYFRDAMAGYSDSFLVRIAKNNYSQYYGLNKYRVFNNELVANTNTAKVTKASCLNHGQITEYPFKISDVITISQTHEQYYQTNLTSQDLTVWYCLYCDVPGDTIINKNIYGSYNDAANNFYIYTYGNVTYTGVGDTTVKQEEEIRLFVNTLILSYRASGQTPTLEILNDNVDITDRYVNIYLDYDVIDGMTALEYDIVNGKFRVYFSTLNVFSSIDVKNYIVFTDETGMNLTDYIPYSREKGTKLTSVIASNGEKRYLLDDSKSWYFDVPIDAINAKKGNDFNSDYQYTFDIKLLTTYGSDDEEVDDKYNVRVIKRGLFNMK